jgi:vacuolar protein sorting-associated protein 53
MSRIYPLLKTLQVRPSPPESLVQAYLIHVADKSDTNFRRILDLKGIRKQDQSVLMELFSAHKSSPRHEDLPQQSTLLTSLLAQATGTGAAISSLSSATTSMQGRFEASNLGSVLMTAARDGVERFGSPALGSGSYSRTVSPPPGGTNAADSGSGNVNQNLRNIGKFFKRDLGGFGGRFGASKGPEETGK